MNYSQKVLFDDWINKCPIEGVFVDEPVSQVRMDDGEFGYLIKVFLTINKEDWEQNQANPGFSEIQKILKISRKNRVLQGSRRSMKNLLGMIVTPNFYKIL